MGGSGGAAAGGAGVGGATKPAFVIESLPAAPVALTSNDSVVAWVDSGNVRSCAIEGCVGDNTLNAQPVQSPVPGQLVMDSQYAYWMESAGATIYRCPFTRCTLVNSVFQSAAQSPFPFTGLGANSAGIYYGDRMSVTLCAGSTCSQVVRRPDDNSASFVVDSTGVYVLLDDEAQGLFFGAIGSNDSLLSTAAILSLSVVAGNTMTAAAGAVYLTNGTTVKSCSNAGCANLPATVFSNPGGIVGIAPDDRNVYWIAADSGARGKIQACPLPSCAGGPVTVVDGQDSPSFLQVSAHYLIWVNSASSAQPKLMGWKK